jgi:hypothetical protein
MSLNLHPRADLSNARIADLEKAMTAFYINPTARYYPMADRQSAEYDESDQPDLVGRAFPGATLLEAVSLQVPRYNCYLLIRKPISTPPAA